MNLPNVVFCNLKNAQCSIYESGKMIANVLAKSTKLNLSYHEIDESDCKLPSNGDLYIFNYHPLPMGWLQQSMIAALPGKSAAIVMEVEPNAPYASTPRFWFDYYLVVDPTLHYPDPCVFAFPRPLERILQPQTKFDVEIPVIGSFGFPTPDKYFERIVSAASKEFERAHIKINIPPGTYVDDGAFTDIQRRCLAEARTGIQVEFSRHYFSQPELIDWCASNTINVFMYNRTMSGLAATTDQAVASGRPLAVSCNEAFRHVHAYINPYPYWSLKTSIAHSQPRVLEMQKRWSAESFVAKFEDMMSKCKIVPRPRGETTSVTLTEHVRMKRLYSKIKSVRLRDACPPILSKIINKLRASAARESSTAISAAPINRLVPFLHPLLSSYAQHQEDLLLDLLTGMKKDGFYIDVGANDPEINSNTRRFYLRGWRGVNIEPCDGPFARLLAQREGDVNINAVVSEIDGKATIYLVGEDTTLTTMDKQQAELMAKHFGLKLSEMEVDSVSLNSVFRTYAAGRATDFLSVDAEGCELNVLSTLDWNVWRPRVVLLEANIGHRQLTAFMAQRDYFLIARNEINAFYLDSQSADSMPASTQTS